MRKTSLSIILFFFLLPGLNPVYSLDSEPGDNSLTVNQISVKDLNGIIKNRNNKYLLLNVWATWCIPCREEFPALKKINQKYKDEVELVGISVDFPDEVESKIKPFLSSLNIEFTNYVSAEKDVEKFISNLNPDWDGTVPATFLFDLKGNQVKYFTGGKSFEAFENVVTDLIK
jgi:thiol-disulfide isomerase/thioredoxin